MRRLSADKSHYGWSLVSDGLSSSSFDTHPHRRCVRRRRRRQSITHSFWATVCKTVRPMLSDRCLSCLSVYDVGVLWPNGWLDQYATWYGGRPRPRPHCVRRGPSSPHVREHSSPTHFLPVSIVAKRSPISATAELLFLFSSRAGFQPEGTTSLSPRFLPLIPSVFPYPFSFLCLSSPSLSTYLINAVVCSEGSLLSPSGRLVLFPATFVRPLFCLSVYQSCYSALTLF